MSDEKKHIINLSRNGTFQQSGEFSTSPQDVDQIFSEIEAQGADHLVVYFHGGLVSEHSGLETARRLLPELQASGAYPLFFVWESGWKETLGDNLERISQDPVFKNLAESVFKFVLAKLTEQSGAHGLTLDLPPTSEVRAELDSDAPFVDFDDASSRQDLQDLTPEQVEQFTQGLEHSMQLEDQVADILDSLQPAAEAAAASFAIDEGEAPSTGLVSDQTELSSEVLEQLQQDNPEGSHGLISTAALVKIAASVLIRSVKRMVEKTDHGVYTTVIEELLRSLYADRVGRYLWDNMKNRTQQAFLDNTNLSGAALHGGTYFLEKLRAHLDTHPDFKLSLVGHSAGGIYICRFIASAAQQVPQLDFQNVIMLAPGCSFDLFRTSILPNKAHIRSFHLFALKDELETKDAIASIIYPRSLLYFVSGVLEGDAEMPLIGMQRFYSGFIPYNKPEMLEVRAYVTAPDQSTWSVTADSGPGLKSLSKGHGEFDNDPLTIQSIVSLLEM